MKTLHPPAHRAALHAGVRFRQRGVVLLFSLIALTIMLIVAVALVRSFNNSLFTAGNIGFKRDLQNQSERAVSAVLTQFSTGALNTIDKRKDNNAGANYSASMLPTNAEGVPLDLVLSNTAFSAKYTVSDQKSTDGSVAVRYLIDRLCATSGDETTLGGSACRIADSPVPAGTSLSNLQGAERTLSTGSGTGGKGAAPQTVIYRVSIRVTGPRNTQSFFQSTFTVPSS